jgi:hypothetical protein
VSIDILTVLLTRLVVEVTWIADMDITINTMSCRIRLDEKFTTEVGVDVVCVVL